MSAEATRFGGCRHWLTCLKCLRRYLRNIWQLYFPMLVKPVRGLSNGTTFLRGRWTAGVMVGLASRRDEDAVIVAARGPGPSPHRKPERPGARDQTMRLVQGVPEV